MDEVRCASLEEVRARIDALDAQIIALLAERGGYVLQAAAFKRSSEEVAAPARVEQVIAKVRARSVEAGLAPEVAETTYRAMIEAFIELERSAFDAP